jgi:hypothetical protein
MNDTPRRHIVQAAIKIFRSQKDLADRALAQVTDVNLHTALDANINSIAVIMQHMAGNMISRWTDFLTSDGEKPGRNRDDEFVDRFATRDEVTNYWNRGWQVLFDTMESLTPADIDRTVHIRGEPHSVMRAIDRQLSHYGYHVGQIVLIARILAGDGQWNTLTIQRGKSAEYNQRAWGKPSGGI